MQVTMTIKATTRIAEPIAAPATTAGLTPLGEAAGGDECSEPVLPVSDILPAPESEGLWLGIGDAL